MPTFDQFDLDVLFDQSGEEPFVSETHEDHAVTSTTTPLHSAAKLGLGAYIGYFSMGNEIRSPSSEYLMLIRRASREYRTWALDSGRWDAYEPHPGDVVIATSPKCGTTWTQQIVSSLIFQDAQVRALSSVSPWIDVRFRGTGAETHRALAAQTHRRFVKTHLPVDGLPLFDEVRYIHVARDGRDVLLSLHNHLTGFTQTQLDEMDRIGLEDPTIGRPYPRFPSDARTFFHMWLTTPVIKGQTEGTPGPSFFELEAGYWAERHRPNFLLVHYNDLKEDLNCEMRRIAEFLSITIAESLWPSLVRAASFEAMQSAGDDLMPNAKRLFNGGARQFFNKGISGRWKSILTDDDLALYDAKVREKLTPGLSAWLAEGRRMTNEPRQMIE